MDTDQRPTERYKTDSEERIHTFITANDESVLH